MEAWGKNIGSSNTSGCGGFNVAVSWKPLLVNTCELRCWRPEQKGKVKKRASGKIGSGTDHNSYQYVNLLVNALN